MAVRGCWRLLVAALLVAHQAAAAEICASPATNPHLSQDMASQTLASYQETARSLAPIALPRPVIATSELALDIRPDRLRIAEPGQLAGLVEDARRGSFKTIDCAEIEEIRGAVLCLFADIAIGNLAFFRAASWIEGTRSAASGHFVADYFAYADAHKAYVDGFDLQGHDLAAYYHAATSACPRDKTACLNAYETEVFEKFLIPLAEQRGDYVLLGTSYGRSGVVSHEILHAQYFLFPKFRAVVDCYFEDVLSEASRKEIRADLAKDYDVENGYLLRNEFQAYLLQSGDTPHLPHLRQTDRPSLLKLLREAGGFPVMP